MKERSNLWGNKRAISPVVATVILVAVTIVVAVAVSYWMGSIAGLYTRYEKVEISSGYASWVSDLAYSNSTPTPNGGWKVTINLRNTGSADATITSLLVNGKPENEYGGRVWWGDTDKMPLSLTTGTSGTLVFYIARGGGFQPGVSIEVKLHSAAGQDYPKQIPLE